MTIMIASGMRKIIHVDMDAFYAAVEQRDRPELQGRPVVVGGQPEHRGVVAAASYEARRYGIRSAMPASRARRLCPDAVFLPPDFEKYRVVSRQIRQVFARYTLLVEPVSLDEAYLDVTQPRQPIPSATWVAQSIKAAIHEETGLTASAGVAPNKFLAKIASDERKPDGLFVIRPQDVAAFVQGLPISKVPGIGRATQARLARLEPTGQQKPDAHQGLPDQAQIITCGDLQRVSPALLERVFGKRGAWFHRIAHGLDDRLVEPNRPRKSLAVEDTFAEDQGDPTWLAAKLEALVQRLVERATRISLGGRTVRGRTATLKIRFADFRTITRSRTLGKATNDQAILLTVFRELLVLALDSASLTTEFGPDELAPEWQRPQPRLRLLGVGLAKLEHPADQPDQGEQLSLPLSFGGS